MLVHKASVFPQVGADSIQHQNVRRALQTTSQKRRAYCILDILSLLLGF